MAIEVTINSLTGTSPYDVYICQFDGTGCFYINTITSGELPYVFDVPSPYNTASAYCVKVIDNLGCVITGCKDLDVSPTPTPTMTPTITPTQTTTPTVTPSVSVSQTITPTQTATSTVTPTPTMTPGLNLSTPFFYEVSYDSLPVITTNSIANAAAAKTLICDFWNGSAQTSMAYGSNFVNPLNVGTYVGLSTTPGTGPMFAGNYIVGNFTTVSGPSSVNYWVVIDGSGFVTEYTLIDPNC